MSQATWPDQWYEVGPDNRSFLEQELLREIGPEHILSGLLVRAIARREDSDDVLFAVIGSFQVAEVHLDYKGHETNPDWPAAVLYQNLSEWQKEYVVC